jgi:hypothetical protein
MKRTPEAACLWADLYGELTSPPPALLGVLLARGAAHVTRLSAIYALLDGSTDAIEVEHISSAVAFWDVVSTSTQIVFRDRTGNDAADRIREFMSPGDELTLSQLRENLFKKISAARLRDACDLLERLGGFAMGVERNTGGRPREVLRRLTPEEARIKRGRNGDGAPRDKSESFSGFSPFSDGVSS